jgi:predicted AAA+ superfamily ATPase
VLEQLLAYFPEIAVRYWRDKSGHEIDFVLPRRRDEVDAIECKWSPNAFDPSALAVFRSYYPKGNNYLITPTADASYPRAFGKLNVTVCTPSALRASSD